MYSKVQRLRDCAVTDRNVCIAVCVCSGKVKFEGHCGYNEMSE